MLNLAQRLNEFCQQQRLSLSSDVQTRLVDYVILLHKWQRVYRLCGYRTPEDMLQHLVMESLFLLPYLPQKETLHLLDVGTGAGIPGLILALAVASPMQTVLLEINSKKTVFLHQAAFELQCKNVTVVQQKVQEYQPSVTFDVIISRAFSELTNMVEMVAHLCAPQTTIMAVKGPKAEREIECLPAGFIVRRQHTLGVPGKAHQLVCIQRG